MSMASRSRILRLRPLQNPLSHPIRPYHSYDHPPPPSSSLTPLEETILSAAIPHIPTHGFTQAALALGAKDAGYIDASTNLFPKGAFSLVHYHLVTQRLALAAKNETIAKQEESGDDNKPMGVGSKVKILTWERLMGNQEIIHRWQEALALLALPSNIPSSIAELAALSDEIWFLAGDVSVDSSWYTKRASLSTLYAATELYMTTDKSPQYIETKEFLDRRFEDVQAVGRVAGGLGQWVGFTAHAGLNVLRSKGVRI